MKNLPNLFLFNLFLLAILILATRLATFLHEFMGHALMAATFGGDVNGVRISLFGGGEVYYHLKMQSGLYVRFLAAFGGILVNMLSGLLPFIFMRRLKNKPVWALFLALFGMVSLLGAIAYSSLGFYYQVGDPVAWIKGPPEREGWFFIPFLAVSPFVSYFAVKSYSILNERWFPSKTFRNRTKMMALTLGIAGCAYAGLYGLTGQRLMAVDAPILAFQRAEREVRKIKTEALYRKLCETRPELSDDGIRRLVEQTPIVIIPDEVPKKFPLPPVIAILYTAGALLALWRTKGGMPGSIIRISPRSVFFSAALAGAILGLLAWTGGWVLPMSNLD
ncbi:MAG: M50 family metallopeptidase [Deltaproteobacteria bacterium]|nr:M50 family metallopeptidase [Deltaproteobacteria bacterium]MBW1861026.1 M50 family metallopeptidase [Deltaproteobacteria bacterium]